MEIDLKQVNENIEKLGQAQAAYIEKNEERLKSLEKGQDDPVLKEQLDKISGSLSVLEKDQKALQLKTSRPSYAPQGDDTTIVDEHKGAFYNGFIRKGDENGLSELQGKALSVGTDSAGGYTVPEDLDREVEKYLVDISQFRSLAKVVQVGNAKYEKLVNVGGMASGWVGETDARTETDTPTLQSVVPPLGELYANPHATQNMLDDSFLNVEQWLADELAEEFAVQEGTAFITGNGTNKPKGITAYTTAATSDATRTFGQVEHLATGVAGDFAASNKGDAIIDLVHTLRSVYRNKQECSFILNDDIIREIRGFKDGNGQYLWRAGLAAGEESTLLGYQYHEMPDMPVKAANSLSIAFGNFRRAYTIVDRMGTRMLRDPYTNKPNVGFYTTKRVGGGLVNDQAIKFLKFSVA